MKKKLIIALVVITSIALTAGIVNAAASHNVTSQFGPAGDIYQVDGMMKMSSVMIGAQDVGGVTYFNGSIVNKTTNSGVDNPVTFGDNVRIDGRVWRGTTAGTSDAMPFIVNDNMEVTGSLTVGSLSGTGVVSTGNIAANAVTQGVEDNNTTITTTQSGTNYDTAAEISITTINSPLFCMFSGYGTTNAVNQTIKIALIVDGVIQVNSYRSATMGGGIGHIILSTNGIYNLAAGTHTIQLGWNTDAGATASMYFNTLDCIELKK